MEYTYKNSGVDINLANATVKEVKKILQNRLDGDFACLVEHPYLEDFFLCATTDGIGTKVLPLLKNRDYSTIANDLIAMNLNDLACVGACPVLFLDYIAINHLDKEICTQIIAELQSQLQTYHCALVGGEIAELKTIIKEGTLDISGYALGLVKKSQVLGKQNVQEGDIVIGLESSGIHTNGYTLINQLADDGLLKIKDTLAPTKIYINEIIELSQKGLIKAAANITGGGIEDNISRIIPDGLCAQITKNDLPKVAIFDQLAQHLAEDEMYKVFNMGCGMAVIASKSNKDEILKIVKKHNPRQIGVVINDKNSRVSLR